MHKHIYLYSTNEILTRAICMGGGPNVASWPSSKPGFQYCLRTVYALFEAWAISSAHPLPGICVNNIRSHLPQKLKIWYARTDLLYTAKVASVGLYKRVQDTWLLRRELVTRSVPSLYLLASKESHSSERTATNPIINEITTSYKFVIYTIYTLCLPISI
jgi:hypothetical protein